MKIWIPFVWDNFASVQIQNKISKIGWLCQWAISGHWSFFFAKNSKNNINVKITWKISTIIYYTIKNECACAKSLNKYFHIYIIDFVIKDWITFKCAMAWKILLLLLSIIPKHFYVHFRFFFYAHIKWKSVLFCVIWKKAEFRQFICLILIKFRFTMSFV